MHLDVILIHEKILLISICFILEVFKNFLIFNFLIFKLHKGSFTMTVKIFYECRTL